VAKPGYHRWLAGEERSKGERRHEAAPPGIEGILASLNYAASFVVIQIAHFTLATKQPAMTGPALARRLERTHEPGGVEAFVDEAFNLLRSQAASVFGKLRAAFWSRFRRRPAELVVPEEAAG
jgi:site-specific recombinase